MIHMRQGMLVIAILASACGEPSSIVVDNSSTAAPDAYSGSDTSTDADPTPEATATTGATVRLSLAAVSVCAVTPPESPGLARSTPTRARVGLVAVELLHERGDPDPVALDLPTTPVNLDFVPDLAATLVTEAAVPAGKYRFARFSLAYGAVTVPAMAHSDGMSVPGHAEFDITTAAYTDIHGSTHLPGQLVATFSAGGMSQSYSGSVPLDCPLSEAGGFVETGDGAHRVTVPLPQSPFVIAAGDPTQAVVAAFPLAGAVTWIDLQGAGFADGILDILPLPTGSETPARVPICDLLLTDRCATGARPNRSSPAWPMPDSATLACTDGATVGTCPGAGALGYGQDGNYQVHAPSYTVAEDTVCDDVTGLLWQRVAGAPTDWWRARDYCDDLVLAGRDDWVLPSRLELATLLDVGRFNPSIDLTAFPDEPADFFWSNSPALFSSLAFGIRFDQGFVYDHDPRVLGRARCVTDTAPDAESRLKVDADVVHDGATQLIWQRAWQGPATWLDALAGCQALALGGFTDWRLPALKELLTIVEDRALNPSTDIAVFPGTPGEWLWASTPGLAPPDYAWAVSFTDGFCTPAAIEQLYLFRCVR